MLCHSAFRVLTEQRLFLVHCSELKEVMAPAEVQLPNGMAWREGSALVYFVDSGEESITEYATDEQVGHFVSQCFSIIHGITKYATDEQVWMNTAMLTSGCTLLTLGRRASLSAPPMSRSALLVSGARPW